MDPKNPKSLSEKFRSLKEKISFKKISFREQMLINAVLFVALFIWGNTLLREFKQLSFEQEQINNTITKNQLLLATQSIVKKRLNEKANELHHGDKISGTDLLSIIGELGTQTSLRPESSRPSSRTEGPFDIITTRITLRNAPLANLIEFDEMISNEFPSIAVTDARFVPAGSDGQNLTATYEITAFLLRNPQMPSKNYR